MIIKCTANERETTTWVGGPLVPVPWHAVFDLLKANLTDSCPESDEL